MYERSRQESGSLGEGVKRSSYGKGYPKKGGKHLFQGRQEIYQFVAANREKYPVEKMCKIVSISRNSFYQWTHTKDKRLTKRKELCNMIKEIFEESKQVYGSYRIQVALEKQGVSISRSYVAKLMKEMGLRSVLSKKFKITTTDSTHDYPIADNVLNRDFTTEQLGQKWVSDITYIKVSNTWSYLTTIIDLADRKVVGWSLSEDMTYKNTVEKAWIMARNSRSITQGFVFHSDRGSQYACEKMRNLFLFQMKTAEGEMKKQSMSRKGNCWDNAVAESFFKSIKYECVYRYNFTSNYQLYCCINEYIKWYNTKRIHSAIGYKTPLEMEMEIREKNNFLKVA